MTPIIITLFLFLILNSITYIKLIEVLKQVNRTQYFLPYLLEMVEHHDDIIDILENLTMENTVMNNELIEIKERLTNIAYTNRHQ